MKDFGIGEVDWNDNVKDENKSLFMRLQQGKNRIRVVSKTPVVKKSHWVDGVGSVLCKGNQCELCEEYKLSVKYLLKVIDRTDNELKILEVTTGVFKRLCKMHKDEEWGPLINYDINIEKTGVKKKTEYSVIPSKRYELTPEELDMIEIRNIDLKKIARGKDD